MNWAPKYPIFEFLTTIQNNCSELQDSQLQAPDGFEPSYAFTPS
jgi:hypothetical protein